jgi:hypothetical protein
LIGFVIWFAAAICLSFSTYLNQSMFFAFAFCSRIQVLLFFIIPSKSNGSRPDAVFVLYAFDYGFYDNLVPDVAC